MLENHDQALHPPNISVVESSYGAVACLSGCIDIDFAPVLRRQLLVLIEARNSRTISIDLSQITHIDSSGIATLIEALKIARASNTALKLQGMHARLLRLLEVTGILPLFNGHQDDMSNPEGKVI